ncbi:MAG TPA: hypothetical protein VI893_06150 [Thermoplasmata archaeon]|nr:hypothetical protein [Thermoplasmata archaeon]
MSERIEDAKVVVWVPEHLLLGTSLHQKRLDTDGEEASIPLSSLTDSAIDNLIVEPYEIAEKFISMISGGVVWCTDKGLLGSDTGAALSCTIRWPIDPPSKMATITIGSSEMTMTVWRSGRKVEVGEPGRDQRSAWCTVSEYRRFVTRAHEEYTVFKGRLLSRAAAIASDKVKTLKLVLD